MKIFVEHDDGKVYEAFRVDENTYTFRTENKTFELFLSEEKTEEISTLSDNQKRQLTKAIFSNEDVLEQLKDARRNRDSEFLYYSGDEEEFDKLVDEVNDGR
jgi:TRAP-type uncharacterized transport system substrate-binding protein